MRRYAYPPRAACVLTARANRVLAVCLPVCWPCADRVPARMLTARADRVLTVCWPRADQLDIDGDGRIGGPARSAARAGHARGACVSDFARAPVNRVHGLPC